MQICTKDIRDGKHVGEMVWICHYHRPDLDKKPLRCVPPTLVLVRSNDEMPQKNFYYTQNHFVKLNKKGEPSTKVYSPVDNTGFRSRSGTELFVFDNEKECVESWKQQMEYYIAKVEVRIANAANYWIKEKNDLLKMKG